tara:strand:+ start:196 stop:423 length:228 start_codon:yes stop_codon:yes gene_type:complete
MIDFIGIWSLIGFVSTLWMPLGCQIMGNYETPIDSDNWSKKQCVLAGFLLGFIGWAILSVWLLSRISNFIWNKLK